MNNTKRKSCRLNRQDFRFGGNNRARTYDPLLVRQMLSQLSYAPIFKKSNRKKLVRVTGLEPAPPCEDQHLKLARLPIPPYPLITV